MPRTKISRLLGAVTLSASLSGTLLAHAQPTTTAPAPSASPAASTPAAAAAPNDDRLAEGRRQFDAGVALLEDPDGAKYEEAYRAFKKAYELTQSSKVLGNLAFAAFHLERDGEAIDAYTQYLRDVSDIDDKERKQIQRDLGTLTATVARLKISVKHAGTSFTLVDRREATRGGAVENVYTFEGSDLSLRVRPGRHNLRVRVGEEESDPVDVTIEPGSNVVEEMKFTPKPVGGVIVTTETKPSLAGPIAVTAIGVAGLAVGIATGLVAHGKQSDMESACPNKACPDESTSGFDLANVRHDAKTFATVSDVGVIAGAVLIVGGVTWGILNATRGSRAATKASTQPSWQVGGLCLRAGCAMNLQRSF